MIDSSGEKGPKVAVFGLGYVGSVTAACLATSGFSVVGVDIAKSKLDDIRDGRAPIGEPGLDSLIKQAVSSGNLVVTDDASIAVQQSNLSLVCVGTPSLDSGAHTTNHLERVCRQIGAALRDATENHVVCIRSTMLPGTLMKVVIRALEAASNMTANKDFHVAVNPEFLREGSAIADFKKPPKIVIGTDSDHAAAVLREINAGIDAPVFEMPSDVAELVKCVNNAWHATKITFANRVVNCAKLPILTVMR